jgi:quercetin dioxygenase-like cupin family protein
MADRAVHHRWEDLPREQLSPLIGRRLITGTDVMIAHVYLAQGAIVPKHSHHNEQVTYILEGRLRFTFGDDEAEVVEIAAGEVLTIPPHLPHMAEALEDTLDVDVFTPPRDDWLRGDDAYLRGGAERE